MYSTTATGGYCRLKCHLNQSRKLFFGPRSIRGTPDPLKSQAAGVGISGDPYTVSLVQTANGGRRYAIPFRIVPDRGQVSENSAKPSSPLAFKQTCDVLQEKELRSKLASKSNDVLPKASPRAFDASSPSCAADVLARKSAGDDIHSNTVCCEVGGGKSFNVIVAGDIGPIPGKNAPTERADFAEGDGFEAASSFKAKAKPSYTAEQIEDAQLAHLNNHPNTPRRSSTSGTPARGTVR